MLPSAPVETKTSLIQSFIATLLMGSVVIFINQQSFLPDNIYTDIAEISVTCLLLLSLCFYIFKAAQRPYLSHDTSSEASHSIASEISPTDISEPTTPRTDSPLSTDNVDSATQKTKQVLANAQGVNTSSKERAQFISSLIGMAEDMAGENEKVSTFLSDCAVKLSSLDATSSDLQYRLTHADESLRSRRDDATRLVEEFRSFDEKLNEIGNISTIISGISKQTTLLALNARIEAARAGEAGAGFSVVSDEIKKLASESANATEMVDEVVEILMQNSKLIRQTIQTINDEIGEVATIMDESMQGMGELKSDASDVQQDASVMITLTNEQNENLHRLISSINDIHANTEKAIVGSQKNIELCNAVILDLDSCKPA